MNTYGVTPRTQELYKRARKLRIKEVVNKALLRVTAVGSLASFMTLIICGCRHAFPSVEAKALVLLVGVIFSTLLFFTLTDSGGIEVDIEDIKRENRETKRLYRSQL